jgi:hypothetical protein
LAVASTAGVVPAAAAAAAPIVLHTAALMACGVKHKQVFMSSKYVHMLLATIVFCVASLMSPSIGKPRADVI